jgi:hypothetical protein
MNSSCKYYQLIPEKIVNELPVIAELLKHSIKGFSIDYLKEIISIVACHIRKDEGSTPLKMIYIKLLVPQGDKYLMGLIDLGIIERSGTFSKEKSICYKYNFAPAYYSKFLSYPLKNEKLILRIEKAYSKIRKENAATLKGHSEQTKYLRLLTIDPDYSRFLEENYNTETDQYNIIKASAQRIENRDIFYSIDTTSGRFHSNITNMSKDLRPYLRIKGEPLVNLDVKNSQLYLSTIILTNPGKVSWMTENPAFALLLQTLKISLNQDVKEFVRISVLGEIYEYLMNEFSKEGLQLTRSETKRQVLRILFARNRMPKDELNRKCRQIFIKSFPTVHKIFSKVRGHEKGDKFNNYKRFAILLQRIESYLMLDVILKRIYKELPDTIAITIHDSIMTGILTNNVEAVRKIMADELTFFVGFRPQIKIEGVKEEKREEIRERINSNQYPATTFVSIN